MLMTDSTLVGANQPSLDQSSFPMAQGQEILASLLKGLFFGYPPKRSAHVISLSYRVFNGQIFQPRKLMVYFLPFCPLDFPEL
jgi:hypothetical protein